MSKNLVLSVYEHGWAKAGLMWPDADNLQRLETATEENAVKLAGHGVQLAEAGTPRLSCSAASPTPSSSTRTVPC
jgi:hypothetical protein